MGHMCGCMCPSGMDWRVGACAQVVSSARMLQVRLQRMQGCCSYAVPPASEAPASLSHAIRQARGIAQTAPPRAPCRSVLMDKGIRGTIPQPDGWKLPDTITDISLGNNNQPPTNVLRGPLPPNWQLPSSEPAGLLCYGMLPCVGLWLAAAVTSVACAVRRHNRALPVPHACLCGLRSLPATELNLLFLGFMPIGGTLPASLNLPSTLGFLLMESSNLTGPLPPWPLPSVQSVRRSGALEPAAVALAPCQQTLPCPGQRHHRRTLALLCLPTGWAD